MIFTIVLIIKDKRVEEELLGSTDWPFELDNTGNWPFRPLPIWYSGG